MKRLKHTFRRNGTGRKAVFTLLAIAGVTVLSVIPVPGVSPFYMKAFFGNADVLGFMNIFSGGSLSRMAVGAFGVSSYITASLVLQQMTIVFPALERTRNDGATGRKRYERIEGIMAVAIAALSGTLLARAFRYSPLFRSTSVPNCIAAVAAWTLGAWIVVKIARAIDEHGIGNGISAVLAANIITGIPGPVISYMNTYVIGQPAVKALLYGGGLALGIIAMIALGILLTRASIDVEIVQSKKKASAISKRARLPISAGSISVLPAIYALALMSLPGLVVSIAGITPKGYLKSALNMLSTTAWASPKNWTDMVGLFIFIGLVVLSAFASCGLSINASEIANRMRKSGDMIPGVKDADMERFLQRRANAMTVVNIVIIAVAVLVPELVMSLAGVGSMTFFGTSMLIVVAVLMDFHERWTACRICDGKSVREERGKDRRISPKAKGLAVLREMNFHMTCARIADMMRCAIMIAAGGAVLSGISSLAAQAVSLLAQHL